MGFTRLKPLLTGGGHPAKESLGEAGKALPLKTADWIQRCGV